MSHEVVKTVGGRHYRYEVQSYRDPQTGKVRGRWRYLGRENEAGVVGRTPRDAGRTRQRLLDALAELLDEREFAELTVSNIAASAGLAHGTFYRYFKDKNAALRAAVQRVREEAERSRPDFAAPLGSIGIERAKIRAWVEQIMRAPVDRPGLLREWYSALAREPELQAERAGRRAETIRSFAGYLRRLSRQGIGLVERPNELAEALFLTIDGAFRNMAFNGKPLGESTIAGLVDLFERAVFAEPFAALGS